jgi:hypothetical protein
MTTSMSPTSSPHGMHPTEHHHNHHHNHSSRMSQDAERRRHQQDADNNNNKYERHEHHEKQMDGRARSCKCDEGGETWSKMNQCSCHSRHRSKMTCCPSKWIGAVLFFVAVQVTSCLIAQQITVSSSTTSTPSDTSSGKRWTWITLLLAVLLTFPFLTNWMRMHGVVQVQQQWAS